MRERHSYVPTEAEVAWAAGLYEGEGTAVRLKTGRGQWLSIRMTDKEPVERMCRLFGGNFKDAFINPGEISKGYKPKYMWRVNAWRDVIRVSNALYPWLSPRRQAQLDVVLVHRPEHPRGELCCASEPSPSVKGYTRHRKLGILPACEICLESVRLYERAKRTRNADAIKISNRAQYVKNREARIGYERAKRARLRAERQQSESSKTR